MIRRGVRSLGRIIRKGAPARNMGYDLRESSDGVC